MAHLTGSIEMQSATLQQLERDEREERMAADEEYAERARLQSLYDQKQGICGLCGEHIDQPADARVLTEALLVDGCRRDKLVHQERCWSAAIGTLARAAVRMR